MFHVSGFVFGGENCYKIVDTPKDTFYFNDDILYCSYCNRFSMSKKLEKHKVFYSIGDNNSSYTTSSNFYTIYNGNTKDYVVSITHGEYVCNKCGKNEKVTNNNSIIYLNKSINNSNLNDGDITNIKKCGNDIKEVKIKTHNHIVTLEFLGNVCTTDNNKGLKKEPYISKISFNVRKGISKIYLRRGNEVRKFKDLICLYYNNHLQENNIFNKEIILMNKTLDKNAFNFLADELKKAIDSLYGYKVFSPPKRSKKEFGYFTLNTDNLTYNSYTYDNAGYNNWVINTTVGTESITSIMTETTGYNTLNRFREEDITLYNLFFYVCMPNVESNVYKRFLYNSIIYNREEMNRRIDRRILRLRGFGVDLTKELFNVFNIPYFRSIAKIIYTDPSNIYRLINILTYFKDINNVVRILINGGLSSNLFNTRDLRKIRRREYKYNKQFIDYMSSKFSETELSNKIIKGYPLMSDSIDIYDKIREYEKLNSIKLIDEKCITGSIKDIHDYLSYVYDKVESKNINLMKAYDDNVLSKQMCIGKYNFCLAKNTHELKDIGREMKICVGSYDDKAVSGSSIIFYVKKGNKYLVCIELIDKGNVVNQAKIFNNNTPSGELLCVILEWIKICGLVNSTKDLEISSLNSETIRLQNV